MSNASKVVLMTGASSGIGAATALHLSDLGYKRLALVARNAERLETVANDCKEKGADDVLVIIKELADLEQCQSIVPEVIEHFGQLDVLINVAAVLTEPKPVWELDLGDLETTLNVNLKAPIILTKMAMPHIQEVKGNVVLVGSVVQQETPLWGMSALCASKAGLLQFGRCAAMEAAAKGVRVNVVTPGLFLTPLLVKATLGPHVDSDDLENRSAVEASKGSAPLLGRLGRPEEMARLIAFVMDEENGYLTGANIVNDGGLSLGKTNV